MAFILGAFLRPGMLLAQDVSFGPSVRVDDADTSRWGFYSPPTLAVDRDGNIYIAWQDGRNNQSWDIYFSSSFDGGATWSKNVMVNDETISSYPDLPCLDVDAKGNLYIAWQDAWWGNVYFSMSTDSGKSWTSQVQVNDWGHCSAKMSPSLTVDDTGITYVTWADDRWAQLFPEIYFSKSTDAGTTWTPNVRVNSPDDDVQCLSSTALDGQGNIYVVWVDLRFYSADIYFSKSIDGGKTWSSSIKVNNVSGGHSVYSIFPSIAVDKGGNLYVVWNYYPNKCIYFGRSTDGGITWSDPNIKVNNDSMSTSDAQPQIDVDNKGRLYVVWDATFPGDTASQIRFAMSTDSGETWSDPSIGVYDSTLILSSQPCLDLGIEAGIYIASRGNRQFGEGPQIYFVKSSLNGIEEEPGVRYQVLDYRLYQNWPNPFNSATLIPYHLTADGRHPKGLQHFRARGQKFGGQQETEARRVSSGMGWEGQYGPRCSQWNILLQVKG